MGPEGVSNSVKGPNGDSVSNSVKGPHSIQKIKQLKSSQGASFVHLHSNKDGMVLPTQLQRARVITHLTTQLHEDADGAERLESLLYNDASSRDYRVRCLEIIRNLEMRPDLCQGHSPEDIFAQTPQSFRIGTPTDQIFKEMSARSIRYRNILQSGVSQIERLGTGESLLMCRKCKGTHVTTEQRQTRSTDEGMSIFATCQTCKSKWKM